MNKEKKKIVILGAGFGGLYAYKSIAKEFYDDEIEVTIVNRNNYFLFTPMLHEVATGSVGHHQVVESVRQIVHKDHTKFHVAELLSVDCEEKVVKTSVGELSYDILIMALGATTNFFNAKGAQEYSLALKDLHDAIKIRNTIIDIFEKASEIKDEVERKKVLSFAIVGGGATGVELVSEMASLFSNTFSKYYRDIIKKSDINLFLVNQGAEILAPFDKKLRDKALSIIKDQGVNVMLNTGVKEVKKDTILLHT